MLQKNNSSLTKGAEFFFKTTSSYLLSREEEQKVPFILLTHVDLDDGADGRLQVVPLRFRRVENLDGVRTSRDAQQRAAVEVHLELAGVERGAHDDDLHGEGPRDDRSRV